MSASQGTKFSGERVSDARVYERPILTKYGNVAEMTRTAAGTSHDNKGASNKS
jgi:hypothetical protein